MKKLIFGLLATVLFIGVSFGKEVYPRLYNANPKTSFINFSKTENAIIWCRDFEVGVNIGVAWISTNVRICCVPSPMGGFLCGPVSRPIKSGTVAYVAVNDLEPQLINEINSKKLTEILITKSSQGMIDNVNYMIKSGTQKIVNIDNVSYLELILEKV